MGDVPVFCPNYFPIFVVEAPCALVDVGNVFGEREVDADFGRIRVRGFSYDGSGEGGFVEFLPALVAAEGLVQFVTDTLSR